LFEFLFVLVHDIVLRFKVLKQESKEEKKRREKTIKINRDQAE
jgi:hypothetical protein